MRVLLTNEASKHFDAVSSKASICPSYLSILTNLVDKMQYSVMQYTVVVRFIMELMLWPFYIRTEIALRCFHCFITSVCMYGEH